MIVTGTPSRTHRVLSVVAAATLLPTLSAPWQSAMARSVLLGTGFGVTFVAVLGVIVVALATRSERLLTVADAVLVLVAAAAQVILFEPYIRGRTHFPVDETVLVERATQAVAAGRNPYALAWPKDVAATPTLLLNGHVADRFGYPPLSPLLGAVLHHVAPSTVAAELLGLLALLACAVISFVALPRWARPLTVMAVFTVGVLPFLAQHAYPIVVAMPFLLVAVVRWHRTGEGGRLGRWGTVQAVALGLAAAAQQLIWFVVPFLIVALWRQRRGELGRRPAALVACRYAGLAVGAFAVVNLPFAVAGPRVWVRALLDPLTQHAIFDGPGVMNVSVRLVRGSGGIDFYGYASLLLFLTLLLAVALYPQRLAPGAVVLPFFVFWLSLRSQELYYNSALPIVLIALGTVGPRAFAQARPVRIAPRLRVVLPALAGAATVACLAVAIAWPAPLSVAVLRVGRANDGRLTALDVRVTNTSGRPIVPHFATTLRTKESLYWSVVRGPRRLAAGARGEYVLTPSPIQRQPPARVTTLWVVSDGPQTLSTAHIPR